MIKLSPAASVLLRDYAEAIWVGSMVLKVLVAVFAAPEKTYAASVAASGKWLRLLPVVGVILLALGAVFLLAFRLLHPAK
jgi:hypothetical protein